MHCNTDTSGMITPEAIKAADKVVELVQQHMGVDVSMHRDQIAEQVFDEGLLEGNWDTSIDLPGISIRLVNDDEYDQHMDEDDENTPLWDEMIGNSGLGYVWAETQEM